MGRLRRTYWESQNPAIAAARGLRSPNPSDRENAARQLMSLGMKEPGAAIPPLIDALGDPEAAVRTAVVEALGSISGDAARTGAVASEVREAIAALIRSLGDREPAVRLTAVRGLLSVTSAKGVAGLVDLRAVVDAFSAMLGDRDDAVRLVALQGLGRCGPLVSPEPPAALAAALEDPSTRNRAAAITVLGNFPASHDPWLPVLLRKLEHDVPEVRNICWRVFARTGASAFSPAAIPAADGPRESLADRSLPCRQGPLSV